MLFTESEDIVPGQSYRILNMEHTCIYIAVCSKFYTKRIPILYIFPAPGLCSLLARAKMLYRRLADDALDIFVHFTY